MPFNREPMTLRKWYGGSVPIPHQETNDFRAFLGTCIGIAASVIGKELDKDISVRFTTVDTAEADIRNKRIHINQDYVKGHFKKRELNDADLIACAIMGIIVHESAHFAFSPTTLKPWVQYLKEKLPKSVYQNEQLFGIVGNVIEDIYIEHETDRRVPLLSWTLDSLNSVFFPDADFEMAQVAAAHISEKPVKMQDATNLLSLTLFAKTRAECHGSEYVQGVFALARKAVDTGRIEDRLNLALELYLEIFERVEGEEDAGSPITFSLSNDTVGGTPEEIFKQIAEYAAGSTDNGEVKGANHLSKESTETNELIERMIQAQIRLSYEQPGASDSTKYFIELVPPVLSDTIEPDLRYDALAQVARQRASTNRPYGQDRNRGHHIRKLYRIATDQKIFAEPVLMTDFQPMQVMVVVDTSGSMFWGGTPNNKPVHQAYRAGIGAVRAFLNARCSVALFGHTADSDGFPGSTVLYRLKGFGEPDVSLGERAFALTSRTKGYLPGNNRDGDALLYLSDHFTQQYRSRLMIVISDGQPNALNYTGDAALKHCIEAVRIIRSKRINVLSISITEEANAINNIIYGEENNTYNKDPNVIEQIIQKILVQ